MNHFFGVVPNDYTMRLVLQQCHGIDQERDGYATVHLRDNRRGCRDRFLASCLLLWYEEAATREQHEMMIALKSGRLLDPHEIRIAGVNCKEFVTGGKFNQGH